MKAHKIVVPLEISEISAEILPVVCRLFLPESTELTLVAVARSLAEFTARDTDMAITPSTGPIPWLEREEWNAYRKGIEDRLYREARHLSEAGYHIHTVVLIGDPVHEIFRFVEQGDFDLLAITMDGNKGLSQQIFGSTAEQILRLVSVPMLVVRRASSNAAETMTGQQTVRFLQRDQIVTIATATDGSPHSQQAVLVAANLAQALQAKLEVLVAVSDQTGAAYDQQVMNRVQELLRDSELQSELTPLVGPTDDVLGHYLEEHSVDLLVLGAFKDRSAGGPANIGTVAHRIAESAQMSVLMVKGQQTQIRHILACFAVGEPFIIDSALQFAKTIGAELHLLHVLPAQTGAMPTLLHLDDAVLNHILAQDTRLATFLQTTVAAMETWGVDRSALQIWRGDTLKTILSVVEKGRYDLSLVGNHSGPNFFRDTLANAVLSYAPISVLVLRTRLESK